MLYCRKDFEKKAGKDTMQIRQLKYVRSIAENRSITQAAQKLFISQQALSETLKLLEQELGFQIFQRSNKGVVPTAAGEKFLQDLEKILPVIDSWKQLAENVQEKRTVKILVQYVLSDLLVNSDFIERLEFVRKNVEIEYEALDAKDLLERIVVEKFSIGLVHLATSAVEMNQRLERLSKYSNFVVEKMFYSKMMFVLQAEDRLAKKEYLNIDDLKGKQIVQTRAFGRTPHMQEKNKYTSKAGCYLPQSVSVLEYILQHDDTISYLPEFIAKNNLYVRDKKLVLRYLENDSDSVFYLVYNQRMLQTSQKLIEEIKKFLSEI